MLSKQLGDALNKQMNNEFESAHSYMAMAAYFDYNNYEGFAHFLFEQATEERTHGMKLYKYLNDRGYHATFTEIQAPQIEFNSVIEVFEAALDIEKETTKDLYDITDLANEEKEHATTSFLRWFLDEQVEEEAAFDTHIEYLKRIEDDQNALFIYERELGERKFLD